MRAILTPFRVNELGMVILKPGRDLWPLFSCRRLLISTVPEFMETLPVGALVDAQQPLMDDPALFDFLCNEKVIQAAGGKTSLERWLMQQDGCQWKDENHSKDYTSLTTEDGVLRLCFHHDNQLREMASIDRVVRIARSNAAEWVIHSARIGLALPEGHQLTLPELCWWATLRGVITAMPDAPARRVLKLPTLQVATGTLKESAIRPEPDAKNLIEEAAKQVLALRIDPESPESYMLRPKRRRWVNESWTRWVKSQPCVCCGNRADDPHHIIGHGQGGMATKAHDLFCIPLCRREHDELHRDPHAFEEKHGSQLELLIRFLDHAISVGVIGTGKK